MYISLPIYIHSSCPNTDNKSNNFMLIVACGSPKTNNVIQLFLFTFLKWVIIVCAVCGNKITLERLLLSFLMCIADLLCIHNFNSFSEFLSSSSSSKNNFLFHVECCITILFKVNRNKQNIKTLHLLVPRYYFNFKFILF